MAIAYIKNLLSYQVDGSGILVVGATPIHDAIDSGSDLDEIWLWASNISDIDISLDIYFGTSIISGTIPAKSGLYAVVPGLVMGAGQSIVALASSDNVIYIFGFVNRIETV